MRKRADRVQKNLPPGQSITPELLRWGEDHPTIGGPVPRVDLEDWVLTIEGEIEMPVELGWTDILKLPAEESVSDFHCVEGWSVLNLRWEGVQFKRIVELVRPRKSAEFVTIECLDGYTTSLTLKNLLRPDVLLAYKVNGAYLEEGLGAPLRLVVPEKYAYKSAMWISKLKFTSTKEMGYWETRGYSDTADVWKNDRFSR